MKVKVEDIGLAAMVDLESCPYLHNHPSAEYEYAVVEYVNRETEDCVIIGYEGIDRVGYPVGTILEVSDETKI